MVRSFYHFLLLICVLTYSSARAQIVINEYSAANVNSIADNFADYSDWIELYNAGPAAVNLTGYYLSDNLNNPTKWVFPSGNISAGGYFRIFCSGRDLVFGVWFHTNFKLTQCKPDELIFSDANGTLIDSLTIRRNQVGHSWGRTTDGANTWSVFTTPTSNASNNSGTPKQPYSPTPVFSVGPGFYPGAQNVSITTTDATATIHYTTDGTEPTMASPTYGAPLNVAATTVVRARGFSSQADIPASFIETNSYFINSPHTIAVLSVAGDDMFDLLVNGSWGAEPTSSLEYFDASGTFRTEATGTSNKHGNDSWAYDQRGFDFVASDQMGYNDALKWKLFRTKNRQKFQRIIIKAAANDNYPFENGAHIRDSYVHHLSQTHDLNLDERSWEPCVVYVNGQYWGVYDMREKVDDADFTDHYFQQDEDNLQFLKTWGNTWSEYGGTQAQTDWNNFKTFVTSNNMANAANWAYVDTTYNWQSLVDYIVLNSYVVTSDWLNWNTAWWRGMDPAGDKKRWRYALWDNDATFGHYINYTGIPDTSPNADPCDPESLPDPGGQGHVPIVNALMTNPTFKQYYINRFVDLMNTTFKCDTMQAVLSSMLGEIQPEMPGQIAKWGGTLGGWQNNVTVLQNYITARCAAMNQGMIDCYNLTGPYELIVEVDPPGAGTVELNSLFLDVFPWTGSYFGGIPIILQTEPTSPQYIFDYWEMVNVPSPSANDDSITTDLTQNDHIIAHYKTIEILENTFIPNAFSPNNDGQNDVLFIHGLDGVQTAEFIVYDRWGQIAFKTNDLSIGWDGKMNGQFVGSGVYAYVLNVTFVDGTSSHKSGNITVVR